MLKIYLKKEEKKVFKDLQDLFKKKNVHSTFTFYTVHQIMIA